MNRKIHLPGGIALPAAAIALWLTGGMGIAQAASAEAIAAGKQSFNRYCAPCHGTDAKGTGPLAAMLKDKPADLTVVYKKFNGVFPFMMVVDTIDRGTPLTAHGGGEMPIWGEAFEDDARGRILDIVLYLNSIQAR